MLPEICAYSSTLESHALLLLRDTESQSLNTILHNINLLLNFELYFKVYYRQNMSTL